MTAFIDEDLGCFGGLSNLDQIVVGLVRFTKVLAKATLSFVYGLHGALRIVGCFLQQTVVLGRLLAHREILPATIFQPFAFLAQTRMNFSVNVPCGPAYVPEQVTTAAHP